MQNKTLARVESGRRQPYKLIWQKGKAVKSSKFYQIKNTRFQSNFNDERKSKNISARAITYYVSRFSSKRVVYENWKKEKKLDFAKILIQKLLSVLNYFWKHYVTNTCLHFLNQHDILDF